MYIEELATPGTSVPVGALVTPGGQQGPAGQQGTSGTNGTNGYDGNLVGTIFLWPSQTPPLGYMICDGSAVNRTTYSQLFTVLGTKFGAGDGSTTFNLPDYRGRIPIGYGQGAGLTNRAIADVGGEETHAMTIAEMAAHAHGISTSTTVSISDPTHNHTWNDSNHAHVLPAHGHGWNDASHVHQTVSGLANVSVNAPGGTGMSLNQHVWADNTAGPNAAVGSVANAGAMWTQGNVTSGSSPAGNNSAAGTGISATAGSTSTASNTGSGTAHNNIQPYLVCAYIIRVSFGISVGPTVPLADTTQNGLLAKVSGVATDYVGGDNACHPMSSIVMASRGFSVLTATYSVSPNDSGKYFICSGGSWTLTLPAPASSLYYQVRNDMGITWGSTTGTITISPSSGVINGQASISLLPQQECTIVSDGTNWRTIGLQRSLVLGTLDATNNAYFLLPVGYRLFEIDGTGIGGNSTSATALSGLFSSDGGNTWWGSANPYYYYEYIYASASTTASAGGGNIASAYLGWPIEASSVPRTQFKMRLAPGTATQYPSWVSESGGYYAPAPVTGNMRVSGFWGQPTKINAIQIYPSAGNLTSGSFTVRGIV